MQFNRPPRIQVPLPNDVVKIPGTPDIPSKPEKNNWLVILLPIGAILLSVLLMSMLMSGGSSTSYLFFLPIMLASSLVGIFATKSQKKKYENEVKECRGEFRSSLRVVEEELSKLQKKEKEIRLSIDPDPSECIYWAQRADSRLGERRPEDPDFLFIRLGIGNLKSSYSIDQSYQEKKKEEFTKEYEFIEELEKTYTELKEVPVHIRFPITGSVGISGNRTETLGLIRAIIGHILIHHWPTELNVAFITQQSDHKDWTWLLTAPHLSPIMKTTGKNQANAELNVLSALETELQKREQQIETSKLMKKDGQNPAKINQPLPRLLIIFDNLPINFSHPALDLLEKKGVELGVFGIFLNHNKDHIPGYCGGVISVFNGRGTYYETGIAGYEHDFICDNLSISQAEMLVKGLAVINWPEKNDASQPPEIITFLDLFGMKRVEDFPLETWWDEKPPFGFLRAPIGRISATSDMIFDLNDADGAHGPHGLLGGMTGSGKSEVLKAIILALAVTHHPYDINFALIDFKGGAAFNELARLPHTVGIVTDIESNATFAERVILALSGEIDRRKRVLEDARGAFGFGRSHIDEYRKLTVRRPLPRLIIVFDEFAEFKQRNPVESKKLISIARQGRSLGVHLILATQNIGAAVDPEILQNSSFRICLKVAEPQDSVQMVGIPDAINLTRGRAYFASNTRVQYQSAFSGANYSPQGSYDPSNGLVRIWPDGRREKIPYQQRSSNRDKSAVMPSTQAGAVVDFICRKAQEMHLKKPASVWPDALTDRYYLPDLISKTYSGGWDGQGWKPCQKWGETRNINQPILPILGLEDLPAKQIQNLLQIDVNHGGHILIFGSTGSGKSTILKTLVTSLALTQTPDEAHIYILDYGGQSVLKSLEVFPHVGAVVTRLELERTERLVQLIRSEIYQRNNLMHQARVDNWMDFNANVSHDKKLPALYLIIDSFRDFKQSFEIDFIESIMALISGGQAAGLYLAIAASLQNDVPNDLFANINMRLSFNQADTTEYIRIVGIPSESKVMEDTMKGVRPGRGLLRGTPPVEFQAALPIYGNSDKDLTNNLISLSEQMRKAWNGKLPAPALTLPDLVTLPGHQHLNEKNMLFSMIGLDFESLSPTGFSLSKDGPTFLIGSTSNQSGKTTLLRSWLLGLASLYKPEQLQIVIIDFHTRTMAAFRSLPILQSYVGSRTALEEVLSKLSEEINRRQQEIEKKYESDPENFDISSILGRWPHILVVIDDYERLHQSMEGEIQKLTDCVKRCAELGFGFVISSKISDLPNSYSDRFVERFRKIGCGILLGGCEGIDEYNNTRRPMGAAQTGLPAGRGFLIKRGKARLLQVAAYWNKNQSPEEGLQERLKILDETSDIRQKGA